MQTQLRKPRAWNALQLEQNQVQVLDAYFYGAGESILRYDFNLAVNTTEAKETWGKFAEMQLYAMCVPSPIALLYSPDTDVWLDVGGTETGFRATDFNKEALNRLASNLLINFDGDGLDFFGHESPEENVDGTYIGTPSNAMQYTEGSSMGTITHSDPETVGTGNMQMDQVQMTAFYQDNIKTWGPSSIFVPYRDELILLQNSVVTTSEAKAFKEYYLRTSLPLNGGHVTGGFFLLIGRRSAVPAEDDPTATTPSTLGHSDDWHTAGDHEGSSYLLANMIAGDHLRVSNMILEQNTKSGSLARSLLFGGSNFVTNTAIQTSEKYNITVKSKMTIKTPYSMIGFGHNNG